MKELCEMVFRHDHSVFVGVSRCANPILCESTESTLSLFEWDPLLRGEIPLSPWEIRAICQTWSLGSPRVAGSPCVHWLHSLGAAGLIPTAVRGAFSQPLWRHCNDGTLGHLLPEAPLRASSHPAIFSVEALKRRAFLLPACTSSYSHSQLKLFRCATGGLAWSTTREHSDIRRPPGPNHPGGRLHLYTQESG